MDRNALDPYGEDAASYGVSDQSPQPLWDLWASQKPLLKDFLQKALTYGPMALRAGSANALMADSVMAARLARQYPREPADFGKMAPPPEALGVEAMADKFDPIFQGAVSGNLYRRPSRFANDDLPGYGSLTAALQGPEREAILARLRQAAAEKRRGALDVIPGGKKD